MQPPTSESRRKLDKFKRLNSTCLMIVRRIYLSYIILLAGLLFLLIGMNAGLQLFYDFKYSKREDYSPAWELGTEISLVGMLLLVSFVFSIFLAKCFKIILVLWKEKQFQEISRKFSNFFAVCGWETSRWVEITLQVMLVITFELIPFLFALAFFFVSKSLSYGIQTYFSAASFVAFFVVLVWWLGGILENYKRLFLLCLRRRSVTNQITDVTVINNGDTHSKRSRAPSYSSNNNNSRSRLPVRSDGASPSQRDLEATAPPSATEYQQHPHARIDDPTTATTMDTISVVDDGELDHEEENHDHEHNFWYLAFFYCWWSPFPLPARVRKYCSFTFKQFWAFIFLLLIFSAVIAAASVHMWTVFTGMTTILLICVMEFLSRLLIHIPQHSPSKRRMEAAWDKDIIQRFVSAIEEVFYWSPSVVFAGCKIITYVLMLTIAVCIISGLKHALLFFFLPLILFIAIGLLYVVRFNTLRVARKFSFRSSRSSVRALNVTSPTEETALLPSSVTTISTDSKPGAVPYSSATGMTKSKSSNEIAEAGDDEIARLHRDPNVYLPNDIPLFQKLSVLSFTISILMFFLILIVFTFVFLGAGSGMFFLGLSVLSCFIVFKRHESETGTALVAFYLLFLLLLGSIFVIGNISTEVAVTGPRALTGQFTNGTSVKYDICHSEWQGFNILDYAFFSALAYETEPSFTQDLNTWFPDCKDCTVYKYNKTVNFFDLYIPSKNLSVVAVRGTDIMTDWVQDADLWKEIAFLQAASLVGPFLNFWPQNLTVDIVYLTSVFEQYLTVKDRFYYQPLFDYVSRIAPSRNVILTGHSLGGGLAKIVGARLGVKAITFCSPGIVYSRKKFSIPSQEAINDVAVSVAPDRDIVSMIDKHGGVLQYIDCGLSVIECHFLSNVITELVNNCGNYPSGRTIMNGS